MVTTSVLDEDPPCLVVGVYTRHHLSNEPHGQNLLALKSSDDQLLIFCLHKVCIARETIQGSLNLFSQV